MPQYYIFLMSRMSYNRIRWILCSIIIINFFRISDSQSDATTTTSDWESSMSELISKLERSTSRSSVIGDFVPLFVPPDKPDIFLQLLDQAKRLTDTSLPAFTSGLSYDSKVLLRRLTDYRNFKADIGLTKLQGIALNTLLADCQYLYAKLVNSPDVNQTFILSVPLAFLHLSALREKSLNSIKKNVIQGDNEKDMSIWLATYWQFVSDTYISWKIWRMSQLQTEYWLQSTVIDSICHAIISDKLLRRHLANLQIKDCNDPHAMDSRMATVQSAYSNQMDFEMMGILSKLFVLHKLVPGYENVGPFAGSFPRCSTLGLIQPLTYQIPNDKVLDDAAHFDPSCQPVNEQLRDITGVIIQQSDRLEGLQIQYKNGPETAQGSAGESMVFDPATDKCLTAIRWRISTTKNLVLSATFTSRDGMSFGPAENREAADITMFSTAPSLYCISTIAICEDKSRAAVTGFKVFFSLPNMTSTMPQPLASGLRLTPRNSALDVAQSSSTLGNTAAAFSDDSRNNIEDPRQGRMMLPNNVVSVVNNPRQTTVPPRPPSTTTAPAPSVENPSRKSINRASVLRALPPAGFAVYFHIVDIRITSGDFYYQLEESLGSLWSEAYGMPQRQLSATIQSVQPIGVDATQRLLTRVYYTVQVQGNVLTPEIEQRFYKILKQSSMSQLVTQPPEVPLDKISYAAEIMVSTPTELEIVVTGLRSSWASALRQPSGNFMIILSGLLATDKALGNTIQARNLTYVLAIPGDVELGETEDKAFQTTLSQSTAEPYLYVPGRTTPQTTTTSTTTEAWTRRTYTYAPIQRTFTSPPIRRTTTTTSTQAPFTDAPFEVASTLSRIIQPSAARISGSPFSFTDAIVLTPLGKGGRNKIMQSIRRAWMQALGREAPVIEIGVLSDNSYNPPITEDGLPIRNIVYAISGLSNGTVDERKVKQRFREYIRDVPISDVYLVPAPE